MSWNPIIANEKDVSCIGWTIEEEREHGTIVHVYHRDSKDDPISIDLPDVFDDGDLASSVWPSSLAGAILCGQDFLKTSFQGKSVLELGSGLGVFGLTAAQYAASVQLTDSNKRTVESLRTHLAANPNCRNLKASVLEWRDEHNPTSQSDIVLGSDVAYYFFLLRPLMDTISAHRQPHDSLACIVGQANRDSLWDLYMNISNGCYNQLTDEREPPWKGDSKMLLYRLEMETWVEDNGVPKSDGVLPIAVVLHATPGLTTVRLSNWDYVATDKDYEAMEMSF